METKDAPPPAKGHTGSGAASVLPYLKQQRLQQPNAAAGSGEGDELVAAFMDAVEQERRMHSLVEGREPGTPDHDGAVWGEYVEATKATTRAFLALPETLRTEDEHGTSENSQA